MKKKKKKGEKKSQKKGNIKKKGKKNGKGSCDNHANHTLTLCRGRITHCLIRYRCRYWRNRHRQLQSTSRSNTACVIRDNARLPPGTPNGAGGLSQHRRHQHTILPTQILTGTAFSRSPSNKPPLSRSLTRPFLEPRINSRFLYKSYSVFTAVDKAFETYADPG